MYRYVDYHVNSILLNITIPPAPGPKATPTTTNVIEGGIIMKFLSMYAKKREVIMNNMLYMYYRLLIIIIII